MSDLQVIEKTLKWRRGGVAGNGRFADCGRAFLPGR